MEYYHPKKTKNNKLLYPIDKNNKFLLDSPNEYFSYSDNDINEKYSDFEESHEIINSLKDVPSFKNDFSSPYNFTKINKEKKIFKNNTENLLKKPNNDKNTIYQNHYNNNFIYIDKHQNKYENNFSHKLNDTYLNHYINKKNISKNKGSKKFEKIKNNKIRKDIIPQDKNKADNLNNKNSQFVIQKINEKLEFNKNKINNRKSNNDNNKIFFNRNIEGSDKTINFNNYIKNSKNIINNKNNQRQKQEKKTMLSKEQFINKSSFENYKLNKYRYKNYNSSKVSKDTKHNNAYTCLRNSLNNNRGSVYDNYFSNLYEYFENSTLNPEIRYSHYFIDSLYNPKKGIQKYSNQNINKKFSKTFIVMNESKCADNKSKEKENNLKNEINLENNKKSSNSQQKSYKKKLLNSNQNYLKKNNINKINKRELNIKTTLDKKNKDMIFLNQINANSTSNTKAISPIASNINNNLINTEKINKNKYDYLGNKKDFKKKISFNISKNNTISNSKTITNKNNVILIPEGINKNKKIILNKKNGIAKNNTKMVYKKRKISNSKYQPKLIKEKEKNENNNSSLILKNCFTDNKQNKDYNHFNLISKNIEKLTLFKSFSRDKNQENSKIEKRDIQTLRKNFDLEESNSDNKRINNYLMKNINKNNENKSKIYMKSILKKWNRNAKNISIPILQINAKVLNRNSFYNKYYYFNIKKNKQKICFETKRYKPKIPINKICVYSKNIILKKEEINKDEKTKIENIEKNSIEENSNKFSIIKDNNSIQNNEEDIVKNNNKEKDNQENSIKNNDKENMDKKPIKINNNELLVEEENENEDFKIEEYEEEHIDSIMNLNKNNLINSNSLMNMKNIVNEEKIDSYNNLITIGKEIPNNSEVGSLMNSKMSINSNSNNKKIIKIEKGLEKLCRLFFRNLELRKEEADNIEELKAFKKDKSDSNLNLKKNSKYSSLFSSTIQNWNNINKKFYEKEDMFSEFNNIFKNQNKKDKKNKKHAKLLNINKAYSEEKVREQKDNLKKSVNILSKIIYKKTEQNNLNEQKNEFDNLLNILNIKNYDYIFDRLLKLIVNENDNVNEPNFNGNCYEKLINNQLILAELIIDKGINDKTCIPLYAKLCKDLYLKLISNYIYTNKKVKGENLKSILGVECRQKFDECDIIAILKIVKTENKSKENNFEKLKIKLIGIVHCICELINVKMTSQKIGLEYLDMLHKRIINFDNDTKNYENKKDLIKYKYLYIEGEIEFLEKLSIIIIERKKPKHIQNLKNFIEDYIISTINNNKNSEQQLSNYLIDKIKNLIEKLRKNKPFKDLKEIKINTINEKKNIIKENTEVNKNTEEENKKVISQKLILDENPEFIPILKQEIEEYLKFLKSHKIDNKEDLEKKSINDINDEFNWNKIDDLIVNKKIPLEKIVIYYIKICNDIICDESIIFKVNEYIKAVIFYYSYNLDDKTVNNMHLKMTELFLNIDNICINNSYMYEVMGFLLYLLLTVEYKFFDIKDLNLFLNKDINTQINLAKTILFTIIAYGNNWKKQYNIFKKISLFKDGDIFNNYISNPLKQKGFKL